MILLRKFKKEDVSELQEYGFLDLSTEQVEVLICDWDKKQFNGKYF